MSIGDLALCLRLGLLEPVPGKPGVYRLTWAGRCLLGDLARPETEAQFLARVEAMKARMH